MNRKSIFLFLIALVASAIVFGSEVKEEHAKKLAKNFYFERINQFESISYESIEIKETFKIWKQGILVYYVFNLNPKGYVMVAADNISKPVPAYSLNVKYSKFNQPENFKAWIAQYSNEIYNAVLRNDKQSEVIQAEWDRYLSDGQNVLNPFRGSGIEPLLTTTWNQDKYYNELCPEDPGGPGGHCLAGCVATAMGQVMNYFRFPYNGTGSYSYECPPYGTLSQDFSEAEYDWDQMGLSLSRSNLEIAELLYHLGISVDMVYGPNGSGMYNHKAAYSLATYFKYDPNTQYVFRDNTTMDWDSLLVTNLDQKIPMYYAGWSVPDTFGHAFVVDGYQEESYYHFNWGWDGSNDGYFYTDDLTPGGSLFNLAQELIINAVPDTINYDYPVFANGMKVLKSDMGTIGDGSGPLFNYENNMSASWLIAPEDSINLIRIRFHGFNTSMNDELKIYRGENESGELAGTYSGNLIPEDIEIEGSRVFITFESDNTDTAEGWLISYYAEIATFCSGTQSITEPFGTITDGSGTYDYKNGTNCIWNIKPENANILSLIIEELDTEEGKDILKIYDGNTMVGEYSGQIIGETINISSNNVFLLFSTDSENTASGWRISYTSGYVGFKELTDNDIKVYPNPVSNKLIIKLKEINSVTHIKLFNIYGQQLKEINPLGKGTNFILETTNFDNGIYFLSFRNNNNNILKKIVINH